ncbi:hypothetical protein IE53DRAFT_388674 [Violaceomyces palustris]|uniref:Uncharacterized protein n=1 Tax=Violaceomyces palustris TaxID=1673888 RepID=A0ACD0NTK1_9BASI|nr:hypothetical protein IE53DRAFT_388674 [Violaceomyces palustris]
MIPAPIPNPSPSIPDPRSPDPQFLCPSLNTPASNLGGEGHVEGKPMCTIPQLW